MDSKILVYGALQVKCPNCGNLLPITAKALLEGKEIDCPICSYTNHDKDKILYEEKKRTGLWGETTTYIEKSIDHSNDSSYICKFTITKNNIQDMTRI